MKDENCIPLAMGHFIGEVWLDSVYTSKEIKWLPWGARHLYAARYSAQDNTIIEGNKMDFTASTLHILYRTVLGCGFLSNQLEREFFSIFYIRPNINLHIAFNMYDFGNYLWGGYENIRF